MTPTPAPSAVTPSAVHSRKAALTLLFLLSLVWGVHWAVVKQGLDYMPPLQYAALRLIAGLLTMIAIVGAQGRLRRPPRSDVSIVLSVGILQIGAGVLIMNLALQAVPAGRSSVLLYGMPLWVAVLMWLFFRTMPRRNEMIGLVLGLTGVLVLVNPTVIDWGVPAELAGTLALVFGAILWAGVTIHIRRHTWVSRPLDLQPWMLLAALVPVAVAALILEPDGEITWGLPTVLILLYSGPLATGFANWASQSITRSLGPLTSAMGFLATPVVGLIAGALILGESLGPIDIAGFALVLGGIAAASLVPPKEAAELVAPSGGDGNLGRGQPPT